MKILLPHSLPRKWLAGILLVAFVLASVFVGYSLQPQSFSTPSAGGHAVINGPAGIVNDTGASGVMQTATYFAATTSATGPAGSYSSSFGGRMIEENAYLTIQVDDARAATGQATQLAESLNGYVASSSFDDSGASASMTLQIPEANFSKAMHSLSGLGVLKAQSISSNDVTDQYVNLQAQLDSYTAEEAALLRILNSSTTVSDALNSENAIQNTQAQINDLEGQLLVMQTLVAFATINVEFTQPAKNPTLDLANALASSLLALYTVATGMLVLGAALVPVAAVGALIYVPYRHFARRKSSGPMRPT